MDDLQLMVSVTFLFLLRIGLPVFILVSIGMGLDRWQSKRETHFEG